MVFLLAHTLTIPQRRFEMSNCPILIGNNAPIDTTGHEPDDQVGQKFIGATIRRFIDAIVSLPE